jgi:alkanesulfonate monooxygenase SsuD/methylene tetrahydromethanopterin reductase-like flavin-dependent oxidoreductase (luciferase family)
MTQIEFGWIWPGGPHEDMSSAVFTETVQKGMHLITGHFDSAWATDHLQFGETPVLEGWTALTYLAAQHPQLKFGHGVLCQSFRNPALLAKMVATLHYLSGERLILGLGAGWKEDEYLAYGYPFPAAGKRIEELDETIQIIKALWHEKQATVRGKHYQVVDAYFSPRPASFPTLVIGGRQPRMLRLIARHADWWNVSSTPINDYRRYVEECERACEKVGRDPQTLRRTWFGGCLCAPTESEVKALLQQEGRPAPVFCGTPAQVIEQLRPFIDLGVDYFMFSCGGFPRLTTLEMLVQEVLPAL